MQLRTRMAALALGMALVAAPAFAQKVEKAKYVFVFIGDGMSMAQVSAAEVYSKAMADRTPGFAKLGFTRFPAQGLTTTYDASSIITDSASAGTAIASGNKTLSGVINMDPGKTTRFKTIAEYAKMKGEVERAPQESVYLLYGGYEPLTVTLTHLVNQYAGIGWTTYSHTGVPVPTYALGRSQSLFDGYYDNTELFSKLAAVMGVKLPAVAKK